MIQKLLGLYGSQAREASASSLGAEKTSLTLGLLSDADPLVLEEPCRDEG